MLLVSYQTINGYWWWLPGCGVLYTSYPGVAYSRLRPTRVLHTLKYVLPGCGVLYTCYPGVVYSRVRHDWWGMYSIESKSCLESVAVPTPVSRGWAALWSSQSDALSGKTVDLVNLLYLYLTLISIGGDWSSSAVVDFLRQTDYWLIAFLHRSICVQGQICWQSSEDVVAWGGGWEGSGVGVTRWARLAALKHFERKIISGSDFCKCENSGNS